MSQWPKIKIQRQNGETADAQAPVIVSASRSTDIPAFYADWFFRRLEVGYSAWTNPFNGAQSFVSYQNTRFIVFWSKNPEPLLQRLDYLKERHIGCYIQFTLNDYEAEGLERGVPPLAHRIDTFRRLVDKLGKGRVVWRFDPLILTDRISPESLLRKIENIGNQLNGYAEKLVFSFADIALYKKVKANLERNNVRYTEWTEEQMNRFAAQLSELNKQWGYQLATCGEKIDIEQYGISHNRCIDDSLYAIKRKDNRDKGQRPACGCIVSKDIGEYNTCPHQCEYCYANTSKEAALRNCARARETGWKSETITGR